jgi:hypothetical protein
MASQQISIAFDLDKLGSYTDEYLAQLWHVCQANPAGFGDREACRTAEVVRFEIVRRWLKTAPVELYAHQGSHVATQARIDELAKRRAMAVSIVEGALDEGFAEDGEPLSGCAQPVGRDVAVEKIVELLESGDRAVCVTFASDGYLEVKREEKPYDDAQKIRREVASGDVNALAVRIDRLRQKAARLRDGRKQTGTA